MKGSGRWVAVGVIIALMLLTLGAMSLAISSVVRHAPSPGAPLSDRVNWGSWGTEKDFTVERTVAVAPTDVLTLTTTVGEVRVTGGGPAGEVAITATVHLWDRNASQSLAESALKVTELVGDKRVEFAAHGVHVGFLGFGFGGGGKADLEIVVPDGQTLRLNTDVGAVTVRRVKGDLAIRSNVGEVRVELFEGRLEARTDVGRIDIRDATLTGPLTLESDVGAISFTGIPAGESRITTDTGSVTLYLPEDRAYRLVLEDEKPFRQFDSELPYTVGLVGTGEPVGTIEVATDIGAVSIRRWK